MDTKNRPLTDAQKEILRVASHHEQISQSRLNTYPTTLNALIQHGFLEQIKVPYSEPYYRITDAGRAILLAR